MLSQNTTTQQVTDRAAADGDTVNIDYAGTVDGVAFTGGTYSGYSLTLGSGSFIDGFEDQIVGHKPGETFDVNVTFPDGYSDSTDADGNAVYTYVRRYARFADAEVPAGTVSLTGILQYDAAGDGRYILKLRDENDCTH